MMEIYKKGSFIHWYAQRLRSYSMALASPQFKALLRARGQVD